MTLKIERKIWQPDFPNEIWLTDSQNNSEFLLTMKQDSENIGIEFSFDYGFGGRGGGTTEIPIKLLRELLDELETNKTVENE